MLVTFACPQAVALLGLYEASQTAGCSICDLVEGCPSNVLANLDEDYAAQKGGCVVGNTITAFVTTLTTSYGILMTVRYVLMK